MRNEEGELIAEFISGDGELPAERNAILFSDAPNVYAQLKAAEAEIAELRKQLWIAGRVHDLEMVYDEDNDMCVCGYSRMAHWNPSSPCYCVTPDFSGAATPKSQALAEWQQLHPEEASNG